MEWSSRWTSTIATMDATSCRRTGARGAAPGGGWIGLAVSIQDVPLPLGTKHGCSCQGQPAPAIGARQNWPICGWFSPRDHQTGHQEPWMEGRTLGSTETGEAQQYSKHTECHRHGRGSFPSHSRQDRPAESAPTVSALFTTRDQASPWLSAPVWRPPPPLNSERGKVVPGGEQPGHGDIHGAFPVLW